MLSWSSQRAGASLMVYKLYSLETHLYIFAWTGGLDSASVICVDVRFVDVIMISVKRAASPPCSCERSHALRRPDHFGIFIRFFG